jgi:hypothetical protein
MLSRIVFINQLNFQVCPLNAQAHFTNMALSDKITFQSRNNNKTVKGELYILLRLRT